MFYSFHVSCVCLLVARLLPVRHMQFLFSVIDFLRRHPLYCRRKRKTPLWPSLAKTDFYFLFVPREWQRTGLGYTYFSMVHLVVLSCRSDPIVLLCNRKDLIYIWVFKPQDCSSSKSMWFLWNIFSKGTHMLQCLCGKSLKKNKNPSGKLMTIMPVYSVPLSRLLCVRESLARWRARLCVIGLFVVTAIDLQSHLCSKWIMQRRSGGWGVGGGADLFRAATVPAASLAYVWGRAAPKQTHTSPPAPPTPLLHHGTVISNFLLSSSAHTASGNMSPYIPQVFGPVKWLCPLWADDSVIEFTAAPPPPSNPPPPTGGGDSLFFTGFLWLLQASIYHVGQAKSNILGSSQVKEPGLTVW